MTEILQSPEARLVLWLTVVAILILLGIYAVSKVRESSDEKGSDPHELLSNFRELHSQGELSDDEYRTIKTMLAARVRQELKGKGSEG
ncbi:MAG TPA: hypothetical protein VGX78_03325 [Pirellulales bacterium]|jgi:uncharacterized membrane protein|nr:hypothetical protein [Pirellulales bacterium]